MNSGWVMAASPYCYRESSRFQGQQFAFIAQQFISKLPRSPFSLCLSPVLTLLVSPLTTHTHKHTPSKHTNKHDTHTHTGRKDGVNLTLMLCQAHTLWDFDWTPPGVELCQTFHTNQWHCSSTDDVMKLLARFLFHMSSYRWDRDAVLYKTTVRVKMSHCLNWVKDNVDTVDVEQDEAVVISGQTWSCFCSLQVKMLGWKRQMPQLRQYTKIKDPLWLPLRMKSSRNLTFINCTYSYL